MKKQNRKNPKQERRYEIIDFCYEQVLLPVCGQKGIRDLKYVIQYVIEEDGSLTVLPPFSDRMCQVFDLDYPYEIEIPVSCYNSFEVVNAGIQTYLMEQIKTEENEPELFRVFEDMRANFNNSSIQKAIFAAIDEKLDEIMAALDDDGYLLPRVEEYFDGLREKIYESPVVVLEIDNQNPFSDGKRVQTCGMLKLMLEILKEKGIEMSVNELLENVNVTRRLFEHYGIPSPI